MSSSRPKLLPPPPLVALVGWIVPGAGYWLIGQKLRGSVVGLFILLLFVAGLLIGGLRVIDVPTGYTFQLILQKPWFIGQILTGPVTLVVNHFAQLWNVQMSHARVYEIGTLYTAVAGMLNLMAIIDCAYRANNDGGR